jgi:hypothetical protein
MRALATIVGLAVTLSAALGRSEGLVTVPLTPNRAITEHLATINGPRRHSPSVEASGRWAALLIRLASRSRHAETRAMSRRYPSAAEFDVTLLLELLG